MSNMEAFKPNWASPPGETIRDLLFEKSITLSDFAESIEVGVGFANSLLSGNEEVTNEIADKLEVVLGADRGFWLTREEQYRQDVKRVYRNLTKDEEAWVSTVPVRSMQKLGWIPDEKDKRKSFVHCLDYFGISSFEQWEPYRKTQQADVKLRTSRAFEQEIGALTAWLRQGEIIANEIECIPFDEARLRARVEDIRKLTNEPNPEAFLPRLVEICAECGVAVVVAKSPEGCRASGATKKVAEDKFLLMFSFRYLSDDHFWFTVFHEIGHLLLHRQEATHIEGMGIESADQEEEANSFSKEVLIPLCHKNEFLCLKDDYRSIIKFARKIGVSPGVIVGQMQYHGIIEHSHNNKLKVRYCWE